MQKESVFKKAVFAISELPKEIHPEIVLCGRSNVGKSSFINSFFGKKNLAKVSSDPGKTRSLNFYEIDKSYYVVDLPGFGYAKASREEQNRWSKLIDEYFKTTKSIALVLHFVDSRHDPMPSDYELQKLVSFYQLPCAVILNKADKLNQSQLSTAQRKITGFSAELKLGENLFFYSSIKSGWKREIEKKIAKELSQLKTIS